MREELVTFQTAKLAKEKGFTENVINYYHIHEGLIEPELIDEIDILLKNYKRSYEVRKNWNTISTEFGYVENFSAPTQSLLQKWLREVHKIEVYVIPYSITNTHKMIGGKGFYEVIVDKISTTWSDFKTYEEALEEGLYSALLLL